MSNIDIVSMLKAGLSTEVVLAKIRASSTAFDTSPAALTKLKGEAVPEPVLLEMVHASAQPSGATPNLSPDGSKAPDAELATPLTLASSTPLPDLDSEEFWDNGVRYRKQRKGGVTVVLGFGPVNVPFGGAYFLAMIQNGSDGAITFSPESMVVQNLKRNKRVETITPESLYKEVRQTQALGALANFFQQLGGSNSQSTATVQGTNRGSVGSVPYSGRTVDYTENYTATVTYDDPEKERRFQMDLARRAYENQQRARSAEEWIQGNMLGITTIPPGRSIAGLVGTKNPKRGEPHRITIYMDAREFSFDLTSR